MRRAQLPVTALPAWTKFNDVTFYDINVQDFGAGKGFGFAAIRNLQSHETFDKPTLLSVPKDLILCAESIEEHARVDKHFRELREAAGGASLRGDILLFLLMQITITSPDSSNAGGVSNPWTEYVRMLPSTVPSPTTWTEEERLLLTGTSLESAVSAKLGALDREFETLREKTLGISWCRIAWSRCLELPRAGAAMVPSLDMVNHAAIPNAYYEESITGDVALLLRPDIELKAGEELTISYGSAKSAAEMLFNYGFIEESHSEDSLVLEIHPFPDDPLGKAKVAAFPLPSVVQFVESDGCIHWTSPFVFLMCLNEEDGLEFKMLLENDGSTGELNVFWQGKDVTEATGTFEALTSEHPLKDVFSLRAVALLQDRTRQQLESLYGSEDTAESLHPSALSWIDGNMYSAAMQLRTREARLLEKAFGALDVKKSELIESPAVIDYLGSMGGADVAPQEEIDTNDDEDFS